MKVPITLLEFIIERVLINTLKISPRNRGVFNAQNYTYSLVETLERCMLL
ncbi:MAG: hypothetical protein ACD_52C00028G0005 [uncultured bacterium]|nr:MAG: hypothetical protein ACD_52C00028G0005 [uncultured bacterium]